MNTDEHNVIIFLNRALKLEYNSIFDYHIYAAAIHDNTLKDALSQFGLMEMEHARLLSDKITALGGIPVFNPPELRKTKSLTIENMLNEHKQGEMKAVGLMNEGLNIIGNPELSWFIGKIKLDEIEHLKEIERLLKEYDDLKKIITVSGQIKWHDDYVENDKDRPWIDG